MGRAVQSKRIFGSFDFTIKDYTDLKCEKVIEILKIIDLENDLTSYKDFNLKTNMDASVKEEKKDKEYENNNIIEIEDTPKDKIETFEI